MAHGDLIFIVKMERFPLFGLLALNDSNQLETNFRLLSILHLSLKYTKTSQTDGIYRKTICENYILISATSVPPVIHLRPEEND